MRRARSRSDLGTGSQNFAHARSKARDPAVSPRCMRTSCQAKWAPIDIAITRKFLNEIPPRRLNELEIAGFGFLAATSSPPKPTRRRCKIGPRKTLPGAGLRRGKKTWSAADAREVRSNREHGFRLRTGIKRRSSRSRTSGFRTEHRPLPGPGHRRPDALQTRRGIESPRAASSAGSARPAAPRTCRSPRRGHGQRTVTVATWTPPIGCSGRTSALLPIRICPKYACRHEDFDPQRVDLREREDRALIIAILTRYEKAIDHDAVDSGFAAHAVSDLFRMSDFQARNFPGESGLLELLFGNLNLRFGFLERRQRADGFGMQLRQSLVFVTEEPHASFSRLHR